MHTQTAVRDARCQTMRKCVRARVCAHVRVCARVCYWLIWRSGEYPLIVVGVWLTRLASLTVRIVHSEKASPSNHGGESVSLVVCLVTNHSVGR